MTQTILPVFPILPMSSRMPPEIITSKQIAKSALFNIEQLELKFSNGEQRVYERLKPTLHEGVIIVPITKDNQLILVREYAAGTEQYELGFVKGGVDKGESVEQAANRELKEEIGFGAKTFTFLQKIVVSPAYFSSSAFLYLAQDLYPEQLKGDEPEPLELVYWPLDKAKELLALASFNEPRCTTALYLTLLHLGLLQWQ